MSSKQFQHMSIPTHVKRSQTVSEINPFTSSSQQQTTARQTTSSGFKIPSQPSLSPFKSTSKQFRTNTEKIETDRQNVLREIKGKEIIVINDSEGEDNEIKMDRESNGADDLPSLQQIFEASHY
jgi:hypothetical protein